MAEASEQERAYRLAYDEVVRALSQQQQVIEGYRSRAGLLLSAAAVTTSFFGAEALRGDALGTWSVVAILFFAGVGVTLLGIMTPGRFVNVVRRPRPLEGLRGFAAAPSIVIEGFVEAEPPMPLPQVYRNVALRMEESWRRVEDIVKQLDLRFRLASVLLLAEVAAWVKELS